MVSITNAIYLADKPVIDICDKFKNLDQDPKLKSRIFLPDTNSRNQIRERNILASARRNFDRKRIFKELFDSYFTCWQVTERYLSM